jgi:transposase-like protein
MLEMSTNGDVSGAGVEAAAAGHEDQGGGAELGFVAGGRAAPGGRVVPDPELVEQAKRRSFTAKYKARILAEADACSAPGAVGELLRREGLYTSHLTYWRKQREDGALKELGKPRGRKPVDTRDGQIVVLTRRAERAEADLAKMKRVVEIQGNVSALLEEMLGEGSARRSTER